MGLEAVPLRGADQAPAARTIKGATIALSLGGQLRTQQRCHSRFPRRQVHVADVRRGRLFPVVELAQPNNFERFLAIVDLRDVDLPPRIVGRLSVVEKAVAETLEESSRAFRYVRQGAVREVSIEDGDDLVVGLLIIEHPQPADWTGVDEDIAVRHRLLRQNADVHRIQVSVDILESRPLRTAARHPLAAVRLWNEPIKRRTEARKELWPIDEKVARDLVELELDRIGRHDLDECVKGTGPGARGGYAVPRVSQMEGWIRRRHEYLPPLSLRPREASEPARGPRTLDSISYRTLRKRDF